jgi:hypothetical protein
MLNGRSGGLLALLVTASPSFADEADKPKPQLVETKAQKRRGTGPDENIKSEIPKNSAQAKPIAKPRRPVCKVQVRNSTAYYVNIYADGTGRGTLSPVDFSYTLALTGTTVLYATAPLTDFTWGPKEFFCGSGETYTWGLLPY